MEMSKLLWIILLSALSVVHGGFIDCERPPYVEHSNVEYLEEDDYIVTVRYSCEPGFSLKGPIDLQCELDSDEWMQSPPVCESEHQISSGGGGTLESAGGPMPIATGSTTAAAEGGGAGHAGHSDGDEDDNDDDDEEDEDEDEGAQTDNDTNDAEKNTKPQEVVEDTRITSEFAKDLDLSCMGKSLISAPDIQNGFVVKYNRLKKDGHIYLVAIYDCDEMYELEDSYHDRLYCSREKWIGERPICLALDPEYPDGNGNGDNYDDYSHEKDDNENANQIDRQPHPHPHRHGHGEIHHHEEHHGHEEHHRHDEHHYKPDDLEHVGETEHHQEGEHHREGEHHFEEEHHPHVHIHTEDGKEHIPCGPDRGGCDHECKMMILPNEHQPRVECSCYSGFTLDPNDGRRCHDIDECQLNNGGCEQTCINMPGHFQCACNPGLQIDTITGNTCVDINECLLNNGHGPCQDTCTNTWGSYRCSCDGLPRTRLAEDDHTCEDAGECANNNGGCSHKCLSTLGRVFCLCPDGFNLSEDWKTCQDINECDDPIIAATCPMGCENLPGSFRCISADEEHGSCDDGYRHDEQGLCKDIDECAENNTGCQFCENRPGGFDCTCPDGFDLADDGKTCNDINECELYSDIDGDDSGEISPYKVCDHECFNTPGGYECRCPENFHLLEDQRSCERDSCKDLTNFNLNKTRCSHDCIDRAEGYECTCPPGYVLDTDFKTCLVQTVFDNCVENGGHVQCMPGVCVNTPDGYSCQCPSGYMDKGRKCHDIDECEAGTSGCSHYCHNNEGSYECRCPPGLELSEGDFKTCDDIDECAQDESICGGMECVNTLGSYRCGCPEGQELLSHGVCGFLDACALDNGDCSHQCVSHNGYAECHCPDGMTLTPDGRNCVDENPCTVNNGGCSQICDRIVPGYCGCYAGYHLSYDGKTCIDHDECQENNGGCSQICRNIEGSYECICKSGFEKLNSLCRDVDECSLGIHTCDSVQVCINTEGSFRCDCPVGFALLSALNKCIDVDECLIDNGNCSHICYNWPGTHQCQCPDGMILHSDNRTCEFINLCAFNNGGCSHECLFAFGKVACACPKGYHLDASQRNCLDVDECAINNGGCSHVCENHRGRYACLCPVGFRLEADNRTCSDIDECRENNGGCSHICVNLLGAASCACDAGYKLHEDKRSCVDEDECSGGNHGCSHLCVNVEGRYQCDCPEGLRLGRDGHICEDINECNEIRPNGGCSHTCVNVVGSFHCACAEGEILSSNNITCETETVRDACTVYGRRCSHDCKNTRDGFQCQCPPGLILADNQFTCVDVNECKNQNGGCSHICENLNGGFRCQCPPGFELTNDQRTCVDRNGCTKNNGGCSHRCLNVEGGGHICDCPIGYRLLPDKRTCESSHTSCVHQNGGCSQICERTPTGRVCGCRPGFMLDPRDNATCHDIDECQYDNPCKRARLDCRNTVGSFECHCPSGYQKDPHGHCVDINECEYNNGGCGSQGKCTNVPGSYKCICGNGSKLSADKKSCLEIKDNCMPWPQIRNGEHHCTRSRHKQQLYYKTKCTFWCHKGYRLEGSSVRHCNGTGHWDNLQATCVPVSCPRLPPPEHGSITPSKCLVGNIVAGERCLLHCQSGFKPADKRVAVCNIDQTWTTNTSLTCIPVGSHGGQGDAPYIKCPQDTMLVLQKEQKVVHIKLEQPKTNVDYWKYVDVQPEWAKHLEAQLTAGHYVLTFRARSPHSNANAVCRTEINIKEPNPPSVIYCPNSIDIRLNPHEASRSVSWKEPTFQSHGHLKQVYKSKLPGDRFTPGVHNIVYVATDRDGQSSKCEFKIIVRAFQHPEVHAAYEANRLENHESYVLCPGKEAMKIETNYPVNLPFGCFIKNVRINPFTHHHHIRRNHRIHSDNILRHYSTWDDSNLHRPNNVRKRHNRVWGESHQ